MPPGPVRVLVDGVGSGTLADSLLDGLVAAGRPPLRVSGADFQRPAGERYQWGREDVEAFRDRWLDTGALRREVLDRPASVLPALWDVERDRSVRTARVEVPPHGVVLVDGLFLLGLGLPAEVVVHVALSPRALVRRGVPEWQLPAFGSYEQEAMPRELADAVVLAEDPRRPALVLRS
ncbi:MAG: uridine kinase [Actinobacteria bacterium]|nr:uridine kinase [Actinomycetota bacterium]MCA1720998.1 uridine kinase [Actinomycetota bacterium]